MAIYTTSVKNLGRSVKTSEKKYEGWQGKGMSRSFLKEREQKVYPFPDADVQKCWNNCQNAKERNRQEKLMTLAIASIVAS